MNHTSDELKVLDFFCGAGGMTSGFIKAGCKVIAGIDIDPNCKRTYELNHSESDFILNDIKCIQSNFFQKKYNLKKNDSSLIMVGCSPCQHWSKINTERHKSETTKNLLSDFTRFVNYYKPGYIVIENVPGIIKDPEGSGLKKFLSFLTRAQYSYQYALMNMAEYGIPQKRIRFVLLATSSKKEICLPVKKNKKTTVRDIISSLPELNAGECDNQLHLHKSRKLSDLNIKRLQKTPHNGGSRLSWKDDDELQINAYKNKDKIFRDVYGRIRWDEPSPTITTKFISISNGRFGHPEQNRALSLLEGALLQTFSPDYQFIGRTDEIIARQIGNAVPPGFSFQLANAIFNHYTAN